MSEVETLISFLRRECRCHFTLQVVVLHQSYFSLTIIRTIIYRHSVPPFYIEKGDGLQLGYTQIMYKQ